MQQPTLFQLDTTGAVISGEYRYMLWRIWDEHLPRILYILLNPSTADATQDDATLRRCIGYARRWGYGSLEIVNLFAFRATRPAALVQAADPVGPHNDRSIQEATARATLLVCGWGIHGQLLGRDIEVLRLLAGREIYCLGTTRDGLPRHPLYLPNNAALERYW